MKANNNPLHQEETRISNEIQAHTRQLLKEWAGSLWRVIGTYMFIFYFCIFFIFHVGY